MQKFPQKKRVPSSNWQLPKSLRRFIEHLSNILIEISKSVKQDCRNAVEKFHIFCWVCRKVAEVSLQCHHFTFEGYNAVANEILETSQKGIERSQKEHRNARGEKSRK